MTSSKDKPVSPRLSPLSIARMLWKRKTGILTISILCSAIVVAVVWKLPAVYESEALVVVDFQKIPEKFVSSTISTDLQDRLATINKQILSSARLKLIINEFGLYATERKTKYEEEVLDLMRQNISVVLERGWLGNRPGAFRVGFRSPDPALAAKVANRIANLYVEENLKSREIQAEGTSEFLESQLREAKKKLDHMEAEVSDYKLRHNGELPQQENALIGMLSRLQIALEANRDALNRAQQTKVALESSLQSAEDARNALARVPEVPASQPADDANEPRPREAAPPGKKRSELLAAQLDLLRLRYADNHPDVKRLTEDLADARRQEAANEAATPPEPRTPKPARPAVSRTRQGASASPESTRLADRIQDLRDRLTVVENDIENRKAEQSQILRDIGATQGKVNKLPLREQEMAGLLRDYDISKVNYQSLLDKKFSAEIAADMEHRQKAERFTIIDPAPVPPMPVKPKRHLLAGLGVLFSFALGIAIGVGNELRSNVLLGEWELPASLPVLATLPCIRIHRAPGSAKPRQDTTPSTHPRVRRFVFSAVAVCVLAGAGAALYFIARPF